jgi:hypothetical protein
MPRPPKFATPVAPTQLVSWAETLGEALGRGVARGINLGLSSVSPFSGAGVNAVAGTTGRRRGRPPKIQLAGPVPPEKLCKVDGCGRPARSKGLCSAHYQAERRRLQAKKA